MSFLAAAILTVAAWATATFSAIVGMGGGVTLLAVMALLLPAALVVPIHGIVQLSSNFTRTVVFLPHVRWRFFYAYAPGLLLGIAAATAAWRGVEFTWFKPAIGGFLVLFLVTRGRVRSLRAPPLWIYTPLGVATGFLSLFVGATGPFIAPFFLREDFRKEEVIATKAICQSLTHLLKIPAFIALGFDYLEHGALLGVLVVMVILGTFTGKKLLSFLDERTFERLFVAVLALLAANLLLGHFV